MTMATRITATPMPLHGIPTSVLCSLNQIKWPTMATTIQPERLPTSLPSAVISVETGSAPTLEQQLSSHLAVFARAGLLGGDVEPNVSRGAMSSRGHRGPHDNRRKPRRRSRRRALG